jgi:hypothetical protein
MIDSLLKGTIARHVKIWAMIAPDKGSKLSHAHFEDEIHAAAQQNADSREGNSNGGNSCLQHRSTPRNDRSF